MRIGNLTKYRCPKCGRLHSVKYSGGEVAGIIIGLILGILPGLIAWPCIRWGRKMRCHNCGTKLHCMDETDGEEILENLAIISGSPTKKTPEQINRELKAEISKLRKGNE